MKNFSRNELLLGVLIFILLLVIGYGGYKYYSLKELYEKETTTLTSHIREKENNIEHLTSDLTESQEEIIFLEEALENERSKNEVFEEQINRIESTVGTLTKLSETDPELLQKYSKVYFLNEHYSPSDLVTIDPKFVFNSERELQIHGEVWRYLRGLLEEAEEDGIDLKVISAYRSFGTQAALKSHYTVTYGSGANTFSADQGYSEHQLGTTVDFTTSEVGSTFTGFENTETYTWLQEEAYRFGFVLSYPPDNSYYQFEPWHWRFVGTKLARDLQEEKVYFYDLDQRSIDEYLVTIFD